MGVCLIHWDRSQVSDVAVHVSATCWYMCKVSKLGQAVTLEPFNIERHVNSQSRGI